MGLHDQIIYFSSYVKKENMYTKYDRMYGGLTCWFGSVLVTLRLCVVVGLSYVVVSFPDHTRLSYSAAALILCIREAPKRVILQTMKNQMKWSIMLHFIWVYTVSEGKKILIQTRQYLCCISSASTLFVKVKKQIFKQEYNIYAAFHLGLHCL